MNRLALPEEYDALSWSCEIAVRLRTQARNLRQLLADADANIIADLPLRVEPLDDLFSPEDFQLTTPFGPIVVRFSFLHLDGQIHGVFKFFSTRISDADEPISTLIYSLCFDMDDYRLITPNGQQYGASRVIGPRFPKMVFTCVIANVFDSLPVANIEA